MKVMIKVIAPPGQAKKMSVAAISVIIGPVKWSGTKLKGNLDLKINKEDTEATMLINCTLAETMTLVKGVTKYNYLIRMLYKTRLMRNTINKMTPEEQVQIKLMVDEAAILTVIEEATPEEMIQFKPTLKERIKGLWRKKENV